MSSPARDEHHDSESFAIVAGGWKLAHNTIRAPGMAEFELYDFANDGSLTGVGRGVSVPATRSR